MAAEMVQAVQHDPGRGTALRRQSRHLGAAHPHQGILGRHENRIYAHEYPHQHDTPEQTCWIVHNAFLLAENVESCTHYSSIPCVMCPHAICRPWGRVSE